jgi:hypothetical protein
VPYAKEDKTTVEAQQGSTTNIDEAQLQGHIHPAIGFAGACVGTLVIVIVVIGACCVVRE